MTLKVNRSLASFVEEHVGGVVLAKAPHKIHHPSLIGLSNEVIVEVQPAILVFGVAYVRLVVTAFSVFAKVIDEACETVVVRLLRLRDVAEQQPVVDAHPIADLSARIPAQVVGKAGQHYHENGRHRYQPLPLFAFVVLALAHFALEVALDDAGREVVAESAPQYRMIMELRSISPPIFDSSFEKSLGFSKDSIMKNSEISRFSMTSPFGQRIVSSMRNSNIFLKSVCIRSSVRCCW